jgi:hypothetical protein
MPKKLVVALIFKKIANFVRRKLVKIAQNSAHGIDPRQQFKTTLAVINCLV